MAFKVIVSLAVAAMCLAGCQAAPTQNATPAEAPPSSNAAPLPTIVTVGEPDNVNLPFQQNSVTLDESLRYALASAVLRAKRAEAITITGYCNRRTIGNARDAALARANVVRQALVQGGVDPEKIQIKAVVDEDLHAVNVFFDDVDPSKLPRIAIAPELLKTTTAAPPAPAQPSQLMLNFAQQSIALDDSAKAGIARILEPAKRAKTISLIGYCDEKEIGNARDAALARAAAVREELVKGGVPMAKIKVNAVTNQPRHAALVALFYR